MRSACLERVLSQPQVVLEPLGHLGFEVVHFQLGAFETRTGSPVSGPLCDLRGVVIRLYR